jgi:hypothetical protein
MVISIVSELAPIRRFLLFHQMLLSALPVERPEEFRRDGAKNSRADAPNDSGGMTDFQLPDVAS